MTDPRKRLGTRSPGRRPGPPSRRARTRGIAGRPSARRRPQTRPAGPARNASGPCARPRLQEGGRRSAVGPRLQAPVGLRPLLSPRPPREPGSPRHGAASERAAGRGRTPRLRAQGWGCRGAGCCRRRRRRAGSCRRAGGCRPAGGCAATARWGRRGDRSAARVRAAAPPLRPRRAWGRGGAAGRRAGR